MGELAERVEDLEHQRDTLRGMVREMQCAAKHLDDLLLRFAFDGGAIGDDVVAGLGVDPWGTLADFRKTFSLEPTMSAEEYAQREGAER